MALKRSKYSRVGDLPADSAQTIRDRANKQRCEAAGRVLLEVVALTLDGIAEKEVTHLTFGRPRSGGAFLATIHYEDATYIRAGGVDLFNLIDQIEKDLIQKDE